MDALAGAGVGRGGAWFVEAPFGSVVLRRFIRGGWAAKLSRDSYLFTTVSRSRPFREFHLLARLTGLGLAVPQPVAAICEHHGLLSTGAIMTVCIPDAKPLAEVIANSITDVEQQPIPWIAVGRCLRKFHRAGVWHADLNARNILLATEQIPFLVDFDRARFTADREVDGKANLHRLKRSLDKVWPTPALSQLEPAWADLMKGYHD